MTMDEEKIKIPYYGYATVVKIAKLYNKMHQSKKDRITLKRM